MFYAAINPLPSGLIRFIARFTLHYVNYTTERVHSNVCFKEKRSIIKYTDHYLTVYNQIMRHL